MEGCDCTHSQEANVGTHVFRVETQTLKTWLSSRCKNMAPSLGEQRGKVSDRRFGPSCQGEIYEQGLGRIWMGSRTASQESGLPGDKMCLKYEASQSQRPRGRFPNYHGWLMSFYLMLIHVILPIKFNQIIPEEARFKGEIVSRFLYFSFLIFTKENDKCSQIITFPHRREVFLRLLWTWL